MTDKKEQNTGVTEDEQVYTLSRPIKFEDKTYTSLNLDFEKLTGADILAVDREIKNKAMSTGSQSDLISFSPGTDVKYQAAIVAKAAGVYIGLMEELSAKDFMRVCQRAQNFLLSMD